MISFGKLKFHKKGIILLLVIFEALLLSSCTTMLTRVGRGELSTPGDTVDGTGGEIPDFDPDESEDTKHREKKEIDYSIDRFEIDGVNAFYILPGLENIPDAMAKFEVLDYNSRGDFVYYYITPCYQTREAFLAVLAATRTGTVKDRTKVSVPAGRREDYEYDAGVLMSYNPDTGNYRVMYANVFQIDKQNEFDPATQGRPYMYKGRNADGDKNKRIYLAERLIGCKVAGREEYLLMDQNSLLGVVYDAEGNALKTMSYKTVLSSEMDTMRKEMKGKKDHGNKKIMNAAVTGLVMTRSYESYLGATFFMGDYDKEDDIDEEDLQISKTMMIHRQALTDENGVSPYVSLNKNADRQREKWLSLDGRFFTGRSELENAEGYSLSGLKNGKYGDEYADDFSAFTAFGAVETAGSFQVQIPNFYDLDGSWYDDNFTNDLIDSMLASDPRASFDVSYSYYSYYVGYRKRHLGLFDQFTKDGGSDKQVALESRISELNYRFPIMHKRLSQIILCDALQRRMKAENMMSAPMGELETYFENKGFLPKPGKYDKERNLNESPEGFYGDPEKMSKVERKEWDPGVSIVSDHIVSVVSQNGIYTDYIAPVDYFPEGDNDWEDIMLGTTGVRMDPADYTDAMERTVYVYDTGNADKQINEVMEAVGLSDDNRKAVEELKLLLRTSLKEWGNVKLGWLLNELMKNPEGLKRTVSEDALKARDAGRLSDEEYKKILELLTLIKNDDEKRNVHETFNKARQDAKKKHDEGGLSDDEYNKAIETLDRAEKEKLGLSDEDWAVFNGFDAVSFMIAEADRAIVSANLAGKADTVARIETLAEGLPEEIRQAMLCLCAGFEVRMEREEGCPLSYRTVFPEGSSIIGYGSGLMMTAGGNLDSNTDGVVVLGESDGKLYNGNAFIIGYENVNTTELFDEYIPGRPVDISSMDYNDGKEITTVVAVCTDRGVKFLNKKNNIKETRTYKHGNLKKKLGKVNADMLCGLENVNYWGRTIYNDEARITNTYKPLSFDARGNEAFKSIKEDTGIPSGIEEKNFRGFLTYRMLLTSTGYTRDIENRLTDAIEKSLEEIGAREGSKEAAEEREKEGIADTKTDVNDRYTGHLNSAKNICMIDKNKALICSVANGTKILDLDHGTVADDMEGSYYRAYQEGSKKTYRLLGFADTSNAYLDVDLPMAKVYPADYDESHINSNEISAFKNVLLQYARDYLYREYRTELNGNGEVVVKEKTEEEERESLEAGRIFDPAVKDYNGALLELERKYGVERTPEEIREYTEELRDRIAGVAPAVTRIYELAGARELAADTAKRNTGYFKNLESRMTMAPDVSSLEDIMVEIRMHDEVLNTLSQNLADKYKTYRSVLDLTKEQVSVSADDIFKRTAVSLNDAEAESARLRNQYREDVVNDIVAEYENSLVQDGTELSGVLTDQEIRQRFDAYVLGLLNRINPDNLLLDDQNTADEFIGVINHGKDVLDGEEFEAFRDSLREGIKDTDSVWLLEELVMRQKIASCKAYSGFEIWLSEYDERVRQAKLGNAGFSVPTGMTAEERELKDNGLSGDERISYLRTSAAYKSIIGDIKQDPEVKEFLSSRRETWDDYCSYVVKKAGLGLSGEEE